MSREEAENGRDNMEIDGCKPQKSPDLDPNYLPFFYEAENGRDNMEIDRCKPQKSPDLDPNYLPFFYGKLFPCEDIFKWMSSGNGKPVPLFNPLISLPHTLFLLVLCNASSITMFCRWKASWMRPVIRRTERPESGVPMHKLVTSDSITFCGWYSGRCGVHCWLNNEQRTAIAGYFDVYKVIRAIVKCNNFPEWVLSTVYANPNRRIRYQLWENLEEMTDI
ncbi:uncharacterized protein LOC130774207 [Actinidia eriantha]|uniref:uncharacterized protein LOC130774207 n=1 Tax=Actinidia eriantha TaxID=165200 RepID=UPI0025900CA3|nr:uncharacterized protein LOC130774207 [Actinidia eriantha]